MWKSVWKAGVTFCDAYVHWQIWWFWQFFFFIQKYNNAEKMLKHVNVSLHRFVLCKTHSFGRKCVIFGMTWWKGVRGTADALIGVLLYCRTHCFRSKNMCCVILHTSMVPTWLFCAVHKAVHNHLPSTAYWQIICSNLLVTWRLFTCLLYWFCRCLHMDLLSYMDAFITVHDTSCMEMEIIAC